MNDIKTVFAPFVSECGSRRMLDHCYGPQAQGLRRLIVERMIGETVRQSDKRCQWGHFRAALLALAGITETCIADGDSQFQELIDRLFPRMDW